MRLTGGRTYYRPSPPKMPPGLVELMEGLSKEVLRHNPSDINAFCAGHLQQLLEKRDGPIHKKSISLEEKIAKAQEKVRLRAEKRRREYDTNMLLMQQSSGDTTIQRHDVAEAPAGQSSDIAQEQGMLNTLKPPVQHDFMLKNLSEVEFSHSSENNDTSKIDALNNATKNFTSSGQSENNHLEEKNETQILEDISLKSDNVNATEILPEISISGSSTENVDTKDDQEISANSILSNLCSTSVTEEKRDTNGTINVTDENQALVDGNIKTVNCINEIDVDTLDSPTYESTLIEGTLPPTTEINAEKIDIENKNDISAVAEDDNSQLSTNVEQTQNSDDKDGTRVDGVNTVAASDNAESQCGQNDPIDIKHKNIEGISESNTDKDASRLESIDVISSTNISELLTSTTHGELEKVSGSNIQEDDKEENMPSQDTNEYENRKVEEQTELKDIKNNEEVETHLDLSATGVDNDIQTLVTDSIINEEVSVVPAQDLKANNDENNTNFVLSPQDNDNCLGSSELLLTENKSAVDSEIANQNGETGELVEKTVSDKRDANNMDLETAAVTIQKVFRNFMFKSRGSTFEDTSNDESAYLEEDDKNKDECGFPNVNALNMERRAHGITRMDTVLQTVNEEKSLSLSTDDSSTLSSAATIIQAHVRGFLVRNKLNSNKTISTSSLAASNSNEPSITSLEADNEQSKNKTILNIHIVPEGENFLSRDESLLTSMDLSLDSSPPSSINLHPLGYDKSERRKQLKREDAIQSISPPSNNSGKLSEDFDSVKELPLNDHDLLEDNTAAKDDLRVENCNNTLLENGSLETISNVDEIIDNSHDTDTHLKRQNKPLAKINSDELDVVTPFLNNQDSTSSKLMHSGEFHDAVLPTRVSRSDTSVVSGE